MADKKLAFFIAAVGAKESPERIRTDEAHKFILGPVVEDALDMALIRADRIKTPGGGSKCVLYGTAGV